ncbi:MAG: UDP-3-O-[3-hydroxymyristoyl] N-acetylglucosamine deacetylase [Proteobacteria bacterium]|nr:MAG: UDP-3-O-[3-hydroxymyristoyl] N-acetylglucosamine deacetylase [Pseudomonadota bacterium]
MQATLTTTCKFQGHGLHTGRPVRMTVRPAPAGHGIVFRRVDVLGLAQDIPALWSEVIVSPLNTRIENADGVYVSTIEHLMAAFAGLGIHNALVEINAPEVPILDGSAAPFVRGLLAAGIRRQDAPLEAIEILAPVELREGAVFARLEPAAGFEIDFAIDFEDAAIGAQALRLNMANGSFLRNLCDSRTFCRRADVEAMQAAGLALGGTYENAVVVEGAQVLSPSGLRHANEPVRHKMLDALGDLYTAGAPILGRYIGNRAGHAVTNRLLRALFAQPTAWRKITVSAEQAARLPGTRIGAADLAHVA